LFSAKKPAKINVHNSDGHIWPISAALPSLLKGARQHFEQHFEEYLSISAALPAAEMCC
jgi:hypothetical protein